MAWPIGVLCFQMLVGGGAFGKREGGNVRAAVGEHHQPGLEGLLWPGDGGDAGAQGKALKGFWWRG